MGFWEIVATVSSYIQLCFFNVRSFLFSPEPFPLLKLPSVPLELITKLMGPDEILKLAMCNLRLEILLKTRKYKIARFTTYLCNHCLRFWITGLSKKRGDFLDIRFHCNNDTSHSKEEKDCKHLMNLGKLFSRFKTEGNNSLDFKWFHESEKLEIYTLISALYSAQELEWVFPLDTVPEQSILESLDFVLSTNFTRFGICGGQNGLCGGQISVELLTEMIDKVPTTKFLDISTNVPEGFKHPDAFKFATTRYRHAHWISIDDLCSVRNPGVIYLDRTNFDSHDINRFLRYWIDCDEDMMVILNMSAQIGTVWDVSVVIGGFVSIEATPQLGYRSFLFNTKNQTSRKNNLGYLSMKGSKILFHALSYRDGCQPKIDLLRLLNQKKALENELEEIRGQETSDELKKRKQEIRDELMVVERKFNDDNVEEYIFRMG